MPKYRVYRTSTVTSSWFVEVDAEDQDGAASTAIEMDEDSSVDNPGYKTGSTGVGGKETAEVVEEDGKSIPEDGRVKLEE